MSTKEFSLQLPMPKISPSDVVAWAGRRWQKPTLAEATRWLVDHSDVLELIWKQFLKTYFDELFDEAAADGYPDPRINEQFFLLDSTITDAAEAYGTNIGVPCYSNAVVDRELLQIAHFLLRERPTKFRACLEMENQFGEPSDDAANNTTLHTTRRVHISINSNKVTAELIPKATCKHEPDVFIPGEGEPPGLASNAGATGGPDKVS